MSDVLASGAIRDIAAELAKAQAVEIAPARSGGNNRVFRVATDDRAYALKFYRRDQGEVRDRLGQEFGALSFLWDAGERAIAEPVARDVQHNCALYGWIEGTPATGDASAADELAAFLVRIQANRARSGAAALPLASAATLSVADALTQLETRRVRLVAEAANDDSLLAFLLGELTPSAHEATETALDLCARAHIEVTASLSPQYRALSPSDFGLHNCLRRTDGSLAFFDFEYFGWDDPAKMLTDAALHPGSGFAPADGDRLARRASGPFSSTDPKFEARQKALFLVFGVIWCLIVLNDFMPGRRLSGTGKAGPEIALLRRQQLEKARKFRDDLFARHDRSA